MKKGFTLIELLAVIVILAIIALIATPIILGIINDARKESQERSVELYASAVRNAIAAYQLTHPNAPTKFSDLNVQYDGEVECAKEELYADGSFYIAECTVNGTEVDYTYGEQQDIQPTRYYSWSSGSIGSDLPGDAKSNASEIDTLGHPFYLALDVNSGNKVTAAYVCFVRNEIEYCLKGGTEGLAYETNTNIIKEAYSDVVNTDACYFEDYSDCSDGNLGADAYTGGTVSAYGGNAWCDIDVGGHFNCYEN